MVCVLPRREETLISLEEKAAYSLVARYFQIMNIEVKNLITEAKKQCTSQV